jgi:cellulose synthase/poly-beta-1,6-N-acetylglucosamine synthase-like glycosyltransferase
MALRRTVMLRVPWTAYGLAEDLQYGRQLRRAKVRVRHGVNAVVSCEAPATLAELCRQRRRWRAAGLWDSKPLVLIHLAAATTIAAALGFAVWSVVLILLTSAIYVRAAWVVGLARKRTSHLFQSPGIILRLGLLTLAGLVRRDASAWERTARENDQRIDTHFDLVQTMPGGID